MSRKYPKKIRKEFKRKLAAAEEFVEVWMNTGLSSSLITDYSCTLTCAEADTYAGIFKEFGHPDTAATILADHGEDCDSPHFHEPRGVWTFEIEANGRAVDHLDNPTWTVVADGENGARAECRALEFLRKELRKEYTHDFWFWVQEAESGVPGSTAIYSWLDARAGIS
ncbi:hypothetical protein GPA10_22455 [Streptomyces sp. p1417]|uniref:Immunity protein Imm1 n=1 Tax=Streptomyces typhae TaxID=2681492 RepID=A0A6L6X0W4_9ACTN|nr:hypothetical protein [Streptomyces typhae]MVO87448.1 hypothetical protein [Streptomyces typhae]